MTRHEVNVVALQGQELGDAWTHVVALRVVHDHRLIGCRAFARHDALSGEGTICAGDDRVRAGLSAV